MTVAKKSLRSSLLGDNIQRPQETNTVEKRQSWELKRQFQEATVGDFAPGFKFFKV